MLIYFARIKAFVLFPDVQTYLNMVIGVLKRHVSLPLNEKQWTLFYDYGLYS